jgi:hypothetical protein
MNVGASVSREPGGNYMVHLSRSIITVVFAFLALITLQGCWIINYASESGIEVRGNTIFVKRDGDFQAALQRAKAGDTILLESGAVFKGSFKLPKKSGVEFITIRSSAAEIEQLPSGTRIDPAKYAAYFAKIESNIKGEPAVLAINGAHHYRFVGVEFGPTVDGSNNIIQIGTGEEARIEELPHHIEFDMVYIHGSPIYGQRRGIAANGKFISVKNSHISEIKRVGDESQAIAAWATDGPIEIINNYLEAGAENILFGGAGSVLKLVPTDCEVRDNHLNKPLQWRQQKWVVKNLFEIKNGRRIRVENNLMTNNWAMGQDGYAILFTLWSENGPASAIDQIDFLGNIVRGAGGGVSISGGEGGVGHRLRIHNNLFENIDGAKWGSAGHFMKLTAWDGLSIENNTILQTGSIAIAYGKPVTKFVFRNNIVSQGPYGFFVDGIGTGVSATDSYFPGNSIANNIIIGGRPEQYKEKNFYATSVRQIGFVGVEQGDYRLNKESPYMTLAPNGGRIGAALDPRTVGVAQPNGVSF